MPLSALYGLATDIRNYLFDRNFFKSVKFPIPVISIGNIAAGGTGKTPHTEFILNVLNKSYKCAVLSRGYKRTTTGFLEVNERYNFADVGDEPLQIARKFSNVNVAVAEKRTYGIKKILEKYPETNVVILDDAFQHRQVKPSLSILLTSYRKLFTTDFLLPAGHLRERRNNYKRADIIIITKCPVNIGKDEINAIRMKINPIKHQRIFFSGYEYSDLIPVFNDENNKKIDFNNLKSRKYTGLILTGIASTKEFWDKTSELCDDTITLTFTDHHDFTRNDIRKIEKIFGNIKNDDKIIITTEKDAIRLVDNKFISNNIKQYFFYIAISVKILDNNEDLFIKTITDHVGKNKRNS
jgi:tetraacyldisaccharide 4'-kinase